MPGEGAQPNIKGAAPHRQCNTFNRGYLKIHNLRIPQHTPGTKDNSVGSKPRAKKSTRKNNGQRSMPGEGAQPNIKGAAPHQQCNTLNRGYLKIHNLRRHEGQGIGSKAKKKTSTREKSCQRLTPGEGAPPNLKGTAPDRKCDFLVWERRYITYRNVSKRGFLISRSSEKLLLAIVPQRQVLLCGSKTSGASPRPHEPRRVAKKNWPGVALVQGQERS